MRYMEASPIAGSAASERFTTQWLFSVALRHLPFICGISLLQVLYPVDPEISTSPVAIYTLINLTAVAITSCVVAYALPASTKAMHHSMWLVALGFILLLLNEVVTWNSETVAEDVSVLAVWALTAIPMIYAMRRISCPRAILVVLSSAIILQLMAFAVDLWDDGALGQNSPSDWFSWLYLLASVTSIAAYQLCFLFLALRPGQASHGWTVTVQFGPEASVADFDVGHRDADSAIAAVEHYLGVAPMKICGTSPIPGTTFSALGLSPGEVRPS